jgi:adenylate cyclase
MIAAGRRRRGDARVGLLAELKRRNVIRMAGLYLVGAWLLVQIAETLLPIFGTPGWVLPTLVVLLALGFVPALVFAWVFELTPEGLRRDSQVDRSISGSGETGRRMDRLIVVGMLAVVALIAADRYWPATPVALDAPDPTRASPGLGGDAVTAIATADGGASAPPPTSAAPNSIAVLPFVNMSEDPANDYFSDGVSEEILNVLAGVGALQVAARTSSFSFKGKDVEVPEIARALNVRLVLEGSVRRQGERVRITAQLIDAAKGFHRWSRSYDRNLDDIFAIQDEIARAIGDELQVEIATNAGVGTADVAAYDLYLRGMALWHTRKGDNLWQAVELFEQAAARDPAFGQAWSGQALAYTVLPAYSGRMGWTEALAQADARALRALALDPEQPEPYAALANAMLSRLERETAEALLQRAIALRPSFATAHQWLGNQLMSSGRLDEALVAMQRATTLDPRSLIIADNHAMLLLALGRNDDAIARCAAALEQAPDNYGCVQYVAVGHVLDGDLAAARAPLQLLSAQKGPAAVARVERLLDALAGRGDVAAVTRELATLPFNSAVDPAVDNMLEDHIVALMLMQLGAHDEALDFLERIAAEPGGTTDWAMALPALDPVRCTPRFRALVTLVKTHDARAARICGA